MKSHRIATRLCTSAAALGGGLLSAATAWAQVEAVPSSQVSEVVVTSSLQQDGSATAGYQSKIISNIGQLGSGSLQDAPYAVNVVPRELLENLQASSGNDALRVDPTVIVTQPTSRGGVGSYTIRGFSLNNAFKSIDGISAFYDDESIEDKERVEVLDGLSGFLNGFANPGGTINFVLKRPTATRYDSVTAGVLDNSTGYIHGDFGGPIDAAGKFGYRFNVVSQDGDTSVDNQLLQRFLFSGALDWHATPDLLLQLDGSHSTYKDKGSGPFWGVASGVRLPSAPDPDKLSGGEPWAFTDDTQDRVAGRLFWTINDALTFRAAAQALDVEQSEIFVNNTIQANGNYTQIIFNRTPEQIFNIGAYAFLDGKFDTGPLQHKATVGYYAHGYETNDTSALTSIPVPGSFSFANPSFAPEPQLTNALFPAQTATARTTDKNLILADQMRLTDQLSLTAGVTQAAVNSRSFNGATGRLTSSYASSAWTPSVSLVFKPIPILSTYFTYQQGLEQGTLVGPSFNGKPISNAGQVLAPGIDTQYELGAKAILGRTLFTVALFDLKKTATLDTLNGSTYTASEDGLEEHKGIEASLTGKVTDDWTVFAGITALRARYGQQSTTTLDGTEPPDVPELYGKLYTEYAIRAVPGLVLTGAVTYVGQQVISGAPTLRLPDSTVGDLGARYTTPVMGRPITFRAQVLNIADTAYWASTEYVGQGRTFSLTAQASF